MSLLRWGRSGRRSSGQGVRCVALAPAEFAGFAAAVVLCLFASKAGQTASAACKCVCVPFSLPGHILLRFCALFPTHWLSLPCGLFLLEPQQRLLPLVFEGLRICCCCCCYCWWRSCCYPCCYPCCCSCWCSYCCGCSHCCRRCGCCFALRCVGCSLGGHFS